MVCCSTRRPRRAPTLIDVGGGDTEETEEATIPATRAPGCPSGVVMPLALLIERHGPDIELIDLMIMIQ